LEQKMARLSREVDSISPSREPSHTPSLDEVSDRRAQTFRGNVISGPRSKYFSPFSWAAIAEEVCVYIRFGYDGRLRHTSSLMRIRPLEIAYPTIVLQALLQVGIPVCPSQTTAFMKHCSASSTSE
jgi:hypothetical protein